MDKTQAYYYLWSQFGMPAYDELSVPEEADTPYITYQVILDDIGYPVYPTASVWYKGGSWADIDEKVNEISEKIETMKPIVLDEGFMYVTKGSPWAQRMADDTDRTVKRYILNLGVEFLTNY